MLILSVRKEDENLGKVVRRNFYMDDFQKSVRTPKEAIEIYQKVRDVLIKGGFNFSKWKTSDDEIKSQIPETDRSAKILKTFEAEPKSSSILVYSIGMWTQTVSLSVVQLSKKLRLK